MENSEEQEYLKIHNLKEVPKCSFCENKCKFISFRKGYLDHCGSKECRRKVLMRSFERKRENSLKYDEFVKQHLDFYKNVTIPFKDIYDGQIVKTHKQFVIRSGSNLHVLDEERTCVLCGKTYIYNKFLNNKPVCNSHTCISLYHQKYFNEYIKYKDKIPLDIFTLNWNLQKFTNDEVANLCNTYSKNIVRKFIMSNAIIYDGKLLLRACSKDPFSFLYNNIIENDMINTCKTCGKTYIRYDKIIKNGKLEYKKIGGDFSCRNKDCYYKCIHLYERSEEDLQKQSDMMKKKIKNGEFTPVITNSWTNNTQKLDYDGLKFRSTWELYYYLYCKFNNVNTQYEKIRIPYFDTIKNQNRIYIVDFYNIDENTLIEIKPQCHQNAINFQDKMIGLKDYCKNNNKNFKVLDENWFKMFYNKSYLNILNEDLQITMKRLLKQFEEQK